MHSSITTKYLGDLMVCGSKQMCVHAVETLAGIVWAQGLLRDSDHSDFALDCYQPS